MFAAYTVVLYAAASMLSAVAEGQCGSAACVCTAIAKQCATDESVSSGVLHIRKQQWAGCDA
jgi:hypothetical protein